MVKNKEVTEMAKKVMRKLKEEVEKKGLKLSITEKGKEGKSKMIALCGFLDEKLRECSREGGVTMAGRVETLGEDLRTRVKKLGVKDKARRKKCKVRFSLIKKNKASHKSYMKVGVKGMLRAAMMPARTWRMAPTERLKLRRLMAAAAGKKEYNLVVHWPPALGRRGVDWKMTP